MTQAPDTEAICERCIWNLDHEGLIRTGPCDPASWAGAVQHELLAFSTAPELAPATGPYPAYMACAAIMMVKDEADIIRHNLDWLYHIGVRRFVVMDNLSTDDTWAELLRFANDHQQAQLAPLRDPVVAYYQADKTTGMAQLAQNLWSDLEWILPIDADEFLVASGGLQALNLVPAWVEALTVPKTVHFLHQGEQPWSDSPFVRMNVRSGLFVVPPKIIVRARRHLGVTGGNHQARRADGGRVLYAGGFGHGFYHREFQTRSFAHFLRKVRNGGPAILAARQAGQDVGGGHWLAWHQVLMEQGEAGLRALFDEVCLRRPGGGYVVDAFLPA